MWRPLCEAALNSAPDQASVALLWRVLAEGFARPGEAGRPFLAPDGLSAGIVSPLLEALRRLGVTVLYGQRLEHVEGTEATATALHFAGRRRIALNSGEAVILAVPADAARRLLPDLPALATSPIINVHYLCGPDLPALPGGKPFLALVGTTAQWLFRRDAVLSVTISAADALAGEPAAALAARLWAEIAEALRLCRPSPPWRVIKERRATLRHSPAVNALRPPAGTTLGNLWLAGDWLATGLPCTMEGAVRSGEMAAQLALSSPGL
ncbi:MAG: FAD-dependent oxidoreductase, partial [Rhodospirillales bacterium]|nr:FAD-dependent oxidoreductase [Rhodospirillales bacterium]